MRYCCKLRVHCLAPDIWLAGFENVRIYCFSSGIWLFFIPAWSSKIQILCNSWHFLILACFEFFTQSSEHFCACISSGFIELITLIWVLLERSFNFLLQNVSIDDGNFGRILKGNAHHGCQVTAGMGVNGLIRAMKFWVKLYSQYYCQTIWQIVINFWQASKICKKYIKCSNVQTV